MRHNERRPTEKTSLFSGCGAFVMGWVFAFLLPGLVLFGVRQHFANQERAREEERRRQQMHEIMASVKPADMGPATRMLLGIDDPADAVAEKGDANANEQPETP